VPVARTYPLDQAVDALAFLREGHPGGKLALIPYGVSCDAAHRVHDSIDCGRLITEVDGVGRLENRIVSER
jgi:hypothetical protein